MLPRMDEPSAIPEEPGESSEETTPATSPGTVAPRRAEEGPEPGGLASERTAAVGEEAADTVESPEAVTDAQPGEGDAAREPSEPATRSVETPPESSEPPEPPAEPPGPPVGQPIEIPAVPEEPAPPAEPPTETPGIPEQPPIPPAEASAVAHAGAEERVHDAERERRMKENAARLEAEIARLRTEHGEGAHRRFRAFFEHERRLHQLFKGLGPLHASDRHRLWADFKQVGIEARKAQQEQWDARRYLSIEGRETIEEKIRNAEGLLQGAGGPGDLRKADALLNEARVLLGSDAPDSPGQVLIGPDRRACWDRWRQVRSALRQRSGELQEQDHQALASEVEDVTAHASESDPFQVIQRVKELQARLGRAYLRRSQFEELRHRLSLTWQAAQTRAAELRRERIEQRAQWRERMEAHVARWRESLENKRAQHAHLLQQVEKLEGMEKNARSDDFAAQVRGWQEETRAKLQRTEASIADLEERIRATARKLGGRPGRTAERPSPAPGESEEPPPPPEPGDPARS